MVGVLNTYVYGDPAAGRAWMVKFNGILSSLGAISCDLDPNYFRIEHSLGRIIFAKHVDELIGAATTEEARDWLHEAVAEHVPVSLFGPWSTVLGFGVHHDREAKTVSMNASKLIGDLVVKPGAEPGAGTAA